MKTSNQEEHKVTKKELNQVFWRSFQMEFSWNYERQMNMGFMYGIAPILDAIYKNPEDEQRKKEAYERHMMYYNCTPQTSAFVLGLASSMEEQYYEDPVSFNPESISAVKTSLMGPLSGVGDSFFQGTIRVLAFGLGINLAQQGSILGPILAMIVSFLPSFFVTYYGGKIGYTMGNKYLAKLYQEGLMDKVMYICSIVGLMVIGSMIASMIGITTPIQMSEAFVLQDVLDNVMPQILPLGITFLMYWLLQKKVKTGWMLAICLIGGIVMSLLGILA